MKAHHPSRDLEVRRRFEMSMARLLSSTLQQRLSIRNQPHPQLLPSRTPFQPRQLLASLAGRRSSPTRHLFSISTPTLLIKQLIILSRAKNPLNSNFPQMQTRSKPGSPKAPLVFWAAKKPPNSVSFPHSRLPRQKETATALCFHHLLHPWKRKPPLVNPQPNFLLRRPQNQRRPSPKKHQPQMKQLYLRNQMVFLINQQPRQLPLSFRLEPLHCSNQPE